MSFALASLQGRALARPLHVKRTASRRGTRAVLVRAAVDPDRDVILVSGCRERVAQCCVDQLSKNERSAGVAIKVTLPHDAYVGVKNPLNAMAKDLVFPDKPMIDCLGALDAVECVDESTDLFKGCLKDATGVILASEYAPTASISPGEEPVPIPQMDAHSTPAGLRKRLAHGRLHFVRRSQ